jgi:hypothetical protein
MFAIRPLSGQCVHQPAIARQSRFMSTRPNGQITSWAIFSTISVPYNAIATAMPLMFITHPFFRSPSLSFSRKVRHEQPIGHPLLEVLEHTVSPAGTLIANASPSAVRNSTM